MCLVCLALMPTDISSPWQKRYVWNALEFLCVKQRHVHSFATTCILVRPITFSMDMSASTSIWCTQFDKPYHTAGKNCKWGIKWGSSRAHDQDQATPEVSEITTDHESVTCPESTQTRKAWATTTMQAATHDLPEGSQKKESSRGNNQAATGLSNQNW